MLSVNRIETIKKEVEQAAEEHLNALDSETALSHFTDDVLAVSNTDVFSSREELSIDVNRYYDSLKSVNYANWEDIHIKVLSESAATFTAKFRCGFTTSENIEVNLRGVWTALFIHAEGDWKIQLRHESFDAT